MILVLLTSFGLSAVSAQDAPMFGSCEGVEGTLTVPMYLYGAEADTDKGIWVYSASVGESQMYAPEGYVAEVHWSPDGSALSYTRREGFGQYRTYVKTIGGYSFGITPPETFDMATYPLWVDSDTIAMSVSTTGDLEGWALYLVDVDLASLSVKNSRAVISGGLREFAPSPDGTHIAVVTGTGPYNVGLIDLSNDQYLAGPSTSMYSSLLWVDSTEIAFTITSDKPEHGTQVSFLGLNMELSDRGGFVVPGIRGRLVGWYGSNPILIGEDSTKGGDIYIANGSNPTLNLTNLGEGVTVREATVDPSGTQIAVAIDPGGVLVYSLADGSVLCETQMGHAPTYYPY